MHGGRRSGSGRPKGARTQKRRPDPVELAAEHGLTPLDYLLNLMRDETVPSQRRDWAAEKAAQYCHPRLAMVAHNTTAPRTINNLKIEVVMPPGYDLPNRPDDVILLEQLPQ